MPKEETKARLLTPRATIAAQEMLDVLRKMESAELDAITGWDSTPDLENIRSAIDHVIEAREILDLI